MRLTSIVLVSLAGGCGDDGGSPAADAPPEDVALDVAADMTTLPASCSLVAQDCPSGYKCTFVVQGILMPGCRPLTGDLAEGAACTGHDGDDACAAGLVCVDDRCQRFCAQTADCADAQACGFYRTGDGLCQTPCTPFDPGSCPPNHTCDVIDERGVASSFITFCRLAGTATTSCQHGAGFPTPCGVDHTCVAGACTPLCDGTHPCATGSCTSIPDFTQAGFCD